MVAGDTVWALAGGRRECVREILAASKIEDARRIQLGMKLSIPEARCPAVPTPIAVAAVPLRAPAREPAETTRRVKATAGALREVATGLAEGSPERPSAEATAMSEAVERAEAELRAARFEQALASAREAHALARALGAESSDPVLRVYLIEATVHVALDDRDAARHSFARALEIDPALVLDPSSTSPKVLDVLTAERTHREVRIARAPAPR